ncbi:MAG TPA: hypothetical protein VLH85_09640 [Levilinea sp.]|nr:hypothetical protein [Levilinea sp.]
MENQQNDTQDISRQALHDVYGQNITIRQGCMKDVKGDHITVRQGGMLKAEAETLEMFQGGVLMARAETANLTAVEAGVVISSGDVTMDQSAVKVLVSNGNVVMDQSASVVLVANKLQTPAATTVFLVAKHVEGTVHTTFGPRESVLFAIVSGLVAGIVLAIASLVKKKE